MRAEILVLNIFLLSSLTLGDKCDKELGYLGEVQKEFVYCSTTNAVPVQICVSCKNQHHDMTEGYEKFLANKNCSNRYIDNDRLNIVSTTQSILLGIWEKAYCDDCFINNNFDVFNEKYNDVQSCLNIKDNVCVKCLPAYQNLNNFYKNLDQHNNAKVCYDIMDKMNRTRFHWSSELNCCHRTFDITLFLFGSSFFAVLPVLFYVGMFMHGKRRERNHGVLDADDADVSPLVIDGVVPSQQDADVGAPNPVTSFPDHSKSISNFNSDSEDSDYGEKSKIF